MTASASTRSRVYVRRFDHEEAARRYRAGETQTELAAEYGVTARAVSAAIARLDDDYRLRQNESAKAWRTTVCAEQPEQATRAWAALQAKRRNGTTAGITS